MQGGVSYNAYTSRGVEKSGLSRCGTLAATTRKVAIISNRSMRLRYCPVGMRKQKNRSYQGRIGFFASWLMLPPRALRQHLQRELSLPVCIQQMIDIPHSLVRKYLEPIEPGLPRWDMFVPPVQSDLFFLSLTQEHQATLQVCLLSPEKLDAISGLDQLLLE